MSKRLYQRALEPFTLDERLRRLERHVDELTVQVAALTANAGPAAPAAAAERAGTGAKDDPVASVDHDRR